MDFFLDSDRVQMPPMGVRAGVTERREQPITWSPQLPTPAPWEAGDTALFRGLGC